ncbi:MAG: hypothetical protein AB1813_15800 [Verrucomicrobiota bacterium]
MQPIRMLSCDTPEKEGFAGGAAKVQPLLDECKKRLKGTFYSAVPKKMRDYLVQRLDAKAAARHLQAGHGATAHFEKLLADRLTTPNGGKRRVAVMPAGDLIDTYGRLLAYFAPYYKNTAADPLPPIGNPARHTLNLNMIADGWAAFFPVFPAIGKPADFNLALAAAESAWDNQLGAWAQAGKKLLLGYEFRLCVKLAQAKTASAGLDAFSRLCIDMRTDRLHDQFGFWQVPPPYRLWVWTKDRASAISQLNLAV